MKYFLLLSFAVILGLIGLSACNEAPVAVTEAAFCEHNSDCSGNSTHKCCNASLCALCGGGDQTGNSTGVCTKDSSCSGNSTNKSCCLGICVKSCPW